MAKDWRRMIGGERVSYTCGNGRFWTNTSRGKPHGRKNRARGSVTRNPLVQNGEFTLWLEYVREEGDDQWYWFMWYCKGVPTIPLSGVFRAPQLSEIIETLGNIAIKSEV